jgi:altronate hydrolase
MIKNGKLIKIDRKDNVAVALDNITAGEQLEIGCFKLTAKENIETCHKIACSDIEKDEDIIKYGYPIGHALRHISPGEYIHTHNIKTNLEGLEKYTYTPLVKYKENFQAAKQHESVQFMGYAREDGSIGIRNEIWIVNTVGCINRASETIAKEATIRFAGRTDGIFAYTHPYGCAQTGDDQRATQKTLAGLVRHPNAAGVLVLSLGCENNNIDEFKKVLGSYDPRRVKFLVSQDVEDEIEEGLKLIDELTVYAQKFKSQPCPVSKLVVGLKCGGSDAFSGITANPLVGKFSDMLIEYGGTTILTEVPEMFGAETILMNRCINKEIFDKTVSLINNFKEYFMRHGQVIYDNPSPGNKKGGLSTLEEKSLGCTQKSGSESVADVVAYSERVTVPGLNLLEGPGNDIVACTALTAAGAHLILFTTGRGTPLGAPVPTIKISTNTALHDRKLNWIDFDAGRLLTDKSMDNMKKEFFDFVLKIAAGEPAKNEKNNFREIAIFKNGITM